MSVNYDKVLTADGHTWLSYVAAVATVVILILLNEVIDRVGQCVSLFDNFLYHEIEFFIFVTSFWVL